ncbi:MAG: MFS transporter [Candidatus Neomarinimicrobiota bacterium]
MPLHLSTLTAMQTDNRTTHQGYRGFPTRFLMRLSTVEGAFSQVQIILTGGVFLTALALSFGAKPWQLGFLAAVPHLWQFFQLVGAYLVEATGERKLITVSFAGLSRFLWLLLPLLYLFTDTSSTAYWFLILVMLATCLGLLAGNAWTTWMADLIPESIRGRYFGYRNTVLATVTISVSLLGGYWLQAGSARWGQPMALTVLVATATLAGMIGVRLLARQPDIPRPPERVAPDLRSLLARPFRNRRFRQVLVFFLLWNAAIGLPAAFFNVHMIQNLAIPFFTIGVLQAINPLFGILLFRWWGRIVDLFQIRSVLLVTGALITIIPLIWLLPTRGHIQWLWVEAVVSGLGWTGFNLSAYTYPMQLSPRIGRSYYLAYFSIISSLGFVVSSMCGGWIVQWLGDWSWTFGSRTFMAHHVLFLASAMLRLPVLLLLFRLRDIKSPGTIALINFIGAELWRTAALRRPFPRWIRRRSLSTGANR